MLVGSTLACTQNEPRATGDLEVVLSVRTGACRHSKPSLAGALSLRRLDNAAEATVSGEDLATGRTIHRELPDGLYTVTWEPRVSLDPNEPYAPWTLHTPGVVNIAAGQVTKLVVHRTITSCAFTSHTSGPNA